MQNDILFDNIYIGHSVEDAKKLQAETFDIKRPIEEELEKASRPDPKDVKGTPMVDSFMKNPVVYVRQQTDLFLRIAKVDFVEACKMVPEIAGGIAALLVTLVALVYGAMSLGKPAAAPAPKAKKEEKKAEKKEEKDEAKASGADVPAGTKRTKTATN